MKHTKLFPFQAEGVSRLHLDFDGRAILGDDPGLGKTIQALTYAWRFLPEDPPGPVVVVCPSYLKLHWAREAFKHLGIRVEVLWGRRVPEDKGPPRDPTRIYVINYEILVPPHWKRGTKPPPDSWVRFLEEQEPRLVIADEAHLLSEPTSARTRAVRRLARKSPRAVLLTGTPLSNNVVGLWSLIDIVCPGLFPSRLDYACEFTRATRKWFGWQFRGARNLDRLHRVLTDHCLIRRRKGDVLGQIPPVTHTVIPVEVDLREYRKAEVDFLGWLDSESVGMPLREARVEEMTRMGHLKRLAGRLKVKAVASWASGLVEETGGKLLLGALHYAVTDELMKAFGDRAVLVDGRVTGRRKEELFYQFNHDRKIKILVGNVQAAGLGWSCKSTADVALCELPWNPGDVHQFICRVHGIERGVPGATAHARYLVAAETIEADLCQILQTKARWASEAVDGVEGDGGLDVYNQCKSLMRGRHR